MIEAEDRSAELLTLRVRPRMVKTTNEEQGRREHHQQGWQIHLAEEEICPKNRSHPSPNDRLKRSRGVEALPHQGAGR